MRCLVFALACLVAAPAAAADLPKPIVKAPILGLPSLSGFYVGAFGGGGKTTERFDFLTLPGSGNLNPSGFQAGAKVGYGQWINTNLMIGIEADAAIDLGRNNVNTCGVMACKADGSWLFTQRAVVGWVMGSGLRAAGAGSPDQWPVPLNLPTSFTESRIVPYLTGGVAERRIKAEVIGIGHGREWLIGWTAGGGVKIPVSQAISFDISYLYVNFNKNFVPADSVPAFAPEFKALSEHVGRVGLTFGF